MSDEEAIAAFKTYLKTLDGFSGDVFNLALPVIEVRYFVKGEPFTEAGQTSRYFGFIAAGIFRAFYLKEGEEITTCLCNETTFATSTVSFITQTPSQIRVYALEDSVVIMIRYEDLQTLYTLHPFWMTFGRKIAETELLFLENYNYRYSHVTPDDKYMNLLRENPGIINRVPLKFIASYLGITPETLSRIRKRTARRIS